MDSIRPHRDKVLSIPIPLMSAPKNKRTNQLRPRMCGSQYHHLMLCDQYPEYRAIRARMDREMQKMLTDPATTARLMGARRKIYTIPVVVHVIHKTAEENISDAQIKSQIAVLNADYSAKNSDKSKVPAVWKGLVGDAGVQFRLATADPKGNATTGITRTQTIVAEFGDNDAMKFRSRGGADAWPSKKYLNIWVCTLGGGLLGYAQFPGMPARTDGVVILNTAFGTSGTAAEPFNLGRTATHEVGHWLNLRHIWGDTNDCTGSDQVEDTPKAQTANTGKPTFPNVTCMNAPNGDMFMNYMDYVDDDSMYMFTSGQVARMRATLTGPRKTFAV